ncbi:TonB-dependent siderophore receptor [Sinomicrobium pectinilyticum]|uniref:TonB-dependent siderophore receptor n=1 Tax=Sinomicrobium pectinilyticum TaxID=1084421 RepID=A0A3N0DFJ5_SINP1|nr:TonB-dependent siderophore receptor [Sinomicrobium pectinilyticum]RNL74438.1 TonB-dependent siderophore receptor [Sinomicrobium pectinilyticum]
MKIRFILVVCFTVISFCTVAQQNQALLRGYITDKEGNLVEGANVVLENSGRGVSSNPDGYYEIKNLHFGSYTVKVSVVGYKTAQQHITLEPGSNRLVNFELEPEVSQLSEVILSGHRKEKYKVENISFSLRLNQELIKIPQNIQVITDDVLRDQQIFGMREGVGRNVSGVMLLEHWGNYARVNMRGFRIPAFRNGMNFTTQWGPVAEDMATVERIEIIKGPAGFMLSAGEPAGLYNVVTKRPTENPRREVTLSTGSYGLQRATVDIGGKVDKAGKLLYRFNGVGHTQKTFQKYGFHDKYILAPSLKYRFNENTSITAQYTYYHSRVPDLGSPYVFSPEGYKDLPRDFSLTHPGIDPSLNKEHSAFVTFEHKLDENWKLTAQLGYLYGTQVSSDIWPDAVEENGDVYRRLYIFDGLEEHKLGQVFVNGEVQTGAVSHHILAGIDVGSKDVWYDWGESHLIDVNQPFNIYAPDNSQAVIPELDHETSIRKRAGTAGTFGQQQYTAYYVQDELGFLEDRLRLTLAGRYTDLQESMYNESTSDGKFTPRAGLSFSIDDNTSVYGLFDQAFLPQSGTDRSGKAFDPIEGNNIEGGIKKKWFDGKWNTSFSYFRITKENMLTADPEDPLNSSVQLGEVKSMGGEFDLQGEVVSGLNLIFNYAYTDVRISKDTDESLVGNRVSGHARHMTNGWLKYTFGDYSPLQGLSISGGYLYMAKRASWDSVWGVTGAQTLPDYFRLDGALSWANDKFSVALNINNLLNEYLFSGSSYQAGTGDNTRFYYSQQNEPGRNFRLTLGYHF